MNIKSFILKREFLFVSNVVLGMTVVVLLLLVMRDFFADPSRVLKGRSIEFNVRSHSAGTGPLERYSVIMEKNPFGFDAGKLTPLNSRNSSSKATPKVSVRAELVGTIATGGADSFAVLRMADGKQEIYRLREHVPGMGTLEVVEPDRVVIRNGEEPLELRLASIKGRKSGPSPAVNGKRMGRPGHEQFVRKGDDGSYVLNGRMVQESISNPQRLMTDARLFPRYKDGKQEGFVLKEVKRGGLYDQLGLRNGDILLRVNEYDITNPESALQAFTALRGVDRLELDIIRDGKTVTLTYYIK